MENEILNTKLRLKATSQDYTLYDINRKYLSKNLNTFANLNLKNTISFLEGKSFDLSMYLIEKSPNIIIGESFKKRCLNTNYLNSYLNDLNNHISSLIINSCCNSETNFFLGIKSINTKDLLISDAFVFVQLNENIILKKLISHMKKDIFWCNSYFQKISKKNYLIPESLKNFENSGIFLNLEHKFQKTQKIFKSLNTLNGSEVLIDFFFQKSKYNFRYLNFINKIHSTNMNNSNVTKFLQSLSRLKKTRSTDFISIYPIKMSFKDVTKIDSFLNNSHTMNISSLNVRFSSF